MAARIGVRISQGRMSRADRHRRGRTVGTVLAGPLAEAAEVGTGAERPSGPGYHDRPHRLVGLERRQGVEQIAGQLPIEGVELVGPIQRDSATPRSSSTSNVS